MLAIPATQLKLAEAAFFYRKLADIGQRTFSPEPEAFGYYLSAFVSAGRSVTLALQAEHKTEYDAWFQDWQRSVDDEQRDLLKDFNAHRIDTVHKRGIEVKHQLEEIAPSQFYFAASNEGVNIQIWRGPPGSATPPYHRTVRTLSVGGTQAEVTAAAGRYLELVVAMVASFTAHHANAAA